MHVHGRKIISNSKQHGDDDLQYNHPNQIFVSTTYLFLQQLNGIEVQRALKSKDASLTKAANLLHAAAKPSFPVIIMLFLL